MSLSLSEVPKVLSLTDEQIRMLPRDKFAKKAVMRLLRRVSYVIQMDVKRAHTSDAPRRLIDPRLVYTLNMRRCGVVFDTEWFSNRDCSMWLPGFIEEHWSSMVFTCRLVNARIDHLIPRHFSLDGALMTDISVMNADATEGEPHRVRIKFDREIFSAYLERVEWSPRLIEPVKLLGEKSLDFLPLPESVLLIVLRFLCPKFNGTATSLRENGSKSIFPFKSKTTQRVCLGRISRMHVTPSVHLDRFGNANNVHGV